MGNGENGGITGAPPPRWLLSLSSMKERISNMAWTPPPLLLVTITNPSPSHPIIQTLQTLELGKLVLTLAATATLGLLFSDHFDSAAGPHQFIISALMVAFMILLIGTLLRTTSPHLGSILELLGIALVLFFFFGLVATFLSGGFSFACWLFGALCLMPFVCVVIIIKPQAAAAGEV